MIVYGKNNTEHTINKEKYSGLRTNFMSFWKNILFMTEITS